MLPEIPLSVFILAGLFIAVCFHLGKELIGDDRKRSRDLTLAEELKAAEERREDEIACIGGRRVSACERWSAS
jgi:hypothetical protein